MPRKPRAPPLQTASSKPLTSAERNAKWRLAPEPAGRTSKLSAPLPGCIPRGNIDLNQLETAATATLALYDKLVRSVNCWLDRLDTEGLSTGEGLVAFRLLPQVLESLAVLRAKISEQRAAEARDGDGSDANQSRSIWQARGAQDRADLGITAQPVRGQYQAEGKLSTAQVLESLAVLRAKISEQRAAEARDVT